MIASCTNYTSDDTGNDTVSLPSPLSEEYSALGEVAGLATVRLPGDRVGVLLRTTSPRPATVVNRSVWELDNASPRGDWVDVACARRVASRCTVSCSFSMKRETIVTDTLYRPSVS